MTTARQTDPVLLSAQTRLFWDEREDPRPIGSPRFIYRVMDIGTWQMACAMERQFSKEWLAEVLTQAPCGALSPLSWNFWCLRLGVDRSYPQRF